MKEIERAANVRIDNLRSGGHYADGLLKARKPGLPGARGQLRVSELGLKIAALGPRR